MLALVHRIGNAKVAWDPSTGRVLEKQTQASAPLLEQRAARQALSSDLLSLQSFYASRRAELEAGSGISSLVSVAGVPETLRTESLPETLDRLAWIESTLALLLEPQRRIAIKMATEPRYACCLHPALAVPAAADPSDLQTALWICAGARCRLSATAWHMHSVS
ncbi:hypothetical protein BC831DRAFT_123582 [Entophlyctis helioformis]|nr:hypothetical protein BC831DRAFT_123582 [Entophlyctis helioformis]